MNDYSGNDGNGNDGKPVPTEPAPVPPDYKVGPGCPPLETRWPKGCPSPNPRGRPRTKHLKSLSAVLDPLASHFLEFDRKATGILDSDGDEITNGTAFLMSLHKRSLKDNRAAELYQKGRQEAYQAQKDLNRAAFEGALAHRERYLDEFVKMASRGIAVPKILPDPRDLILEGDGNVRVVGPLNIEEKKVVDAAVDLRDRCLEIISEIHSKPPEIRKDFLDTRDYLRRKIYRLNRHIPPRLKMKIPRLPDGDGL